MKCKIIIVIDECGDCPFLRLVGHGRFVCAYNAKDTTPDTKFPKWCPLQDYKCDLLPQEPAKPARVFDAEKVLSLMGIDE